jgi:hypothetical protein
MTPIHPGDFELDRVADELPSNPPATTPSCVPTDQTAAEPAGAATVPAPIDGLGFSGMVSPPIAATKAAGRGCETERGKVFALRI